VEVADGEVWPLAPSWMEMWAAAELCTEAAKQVGDAQMSPSSMSDLRNAYVIPVAP